MPDQEFRIADDFAPQSLAEWRALVEKDLRGASFDSLRSETESGLPLSPLYTREDAVDPAAVGFPGLPPFTRGGDASGRGWVVRQEYDDPRADVIRAQLREDLERGVEAIFLHLGVDRGLRVHTAGDLAHALGDLDPSAVDVWLSAGEDALGVAAAYEAHALRRGVSADSLRVSFGADPLGALAARGVLRSGFRGAYRDMRALALHARELGPGVRAVRVDSAPYAEAGATAVDELAFTLSTYAGYLGSLVEWGLSADEAAAQIDLAVSTGGQFFEQIAKLRALRLLVAKVAKASGVSDRAAVAPLHARNGRFTKTRRDPWVNLLRGTAESFAAALGGADSVATAPFDAAYETSDGFARRLARNTQLVLREESKVGEVLDPAGGSYFLERLTDEMARAAWEVFREIEGRGGMQAALVSGLVTSRLDASEGRRVTRLRRRQRVVLGVSEFPNIEEAALTRESVDLREVDGELGREFGDGDEDERYMALIDVNTAAQQRAEGGALLDAAARALSKGVDLISLREVLERGEAMVGCEPLGARRVAELWERLRAASDDYLARLGARPKVFVARLGTVAEHTARATWAQNLLAAGGLEVVSPDGLSTNDELAAALRASGATVALIAGPDARYDEALPGLTQALAEAGASTVLLAGKPQKEGARDQGIHHFVHVGADVYGVLEGLHQSLGAE